MPLDTFCGEAICVDIREYERGHDVTAAEVEAAVEAGGQELRAGDILLFCSDHYNRTAGTPAFLDGFCGISAEAVHWMADRGVKIFGVETISPDLVYLTDEYPTHKACAERGLTHYENLNNLKDVLGPPLPVLRLPAAARARRTARRCGRPRSWRTEMSSTLLNRTTATRRTRSPTTSATRSCPSCGSGGWRRTATTVGPM